MPAARTARKARISKLLVVDASVMAAAGGEETTHPTGTNARDTLKAILTICHRVCLSPDLSEEWKAHQSRFAKRWLTQMYAARKVVRCDPPDRGDLLAEIRSFRSITPSDIAAVEKDIHLIATALLADRAVLSWDNRVAVAIRKVCADKATMTSRTIGDMLWIDPITDNAALHGWLSETGPAEPSWQLGVAAILPAVAERSRIRPARRSKR